MSIANRSLKRAALAAIVWGATAVPTPIEPRPRSNTLWRVVHDLCVPDREVFGSALPCDAVDIKAGYAVVPDPGGGKQVLLVPTRRIVGIEDAALLEPMAPNYWQDAWNIRGLLIRRLNRVVSRAGLGMAVNSIQGRSQQQLHIHLSCVKPDIADRLRAISPGLGDSWSAVRLQGRAWKARIVLGDDLGSSDPFKLAAAATPDAPARMGRMVLAVIGAELSDRRPGFYVLFRIAQPSAIDAGHGETLLDEACGGGSTQA